jgi:RHS repeat-associated protein
VWGLQTSPAQSAPAQAVLTDALSQVTKLILDPYAQPLSWSTPEGGTAAWQRDFAGQAITYTDALGHPTQYVYTYTPNGQGGDLTKITFADATTNLFQYDDTFHHLTVFTDGKGNTTTWTRDTTTGDVLAVKDALGHVSSMAYYQVGGRSSGLLQSITDPLGHVMTYVFDTPSRRLLAIVDALGNRTTLGYDTAGNVASVQDPLGHTTSYGYDGMRRLVTTTTPDGGVSSIVYDGAGDVLTVTDPLGHVTSFAYDARALPTTMTEAVGTPQQRTSTYLYDALQRLLSATNPAGQIASFGYDPVGRVTTAIDAFGSPVQRSATMLYDLDGNLVSETTGIATTNPHLETTSIGYDLVNRPTQIIEAYGSSVQRTGTMIYDAAGNLLSETTGIAASNPVVLTSSFGYDAVNRVTQEVDAFGTSLQRTSTLSYDAASNLLSVTDPLNRTMSYGYDADNRVNQVILAQATPQQSSATMIYDAAGNLLSETTGIGTVPMNSNAVTSSFAYDVMNRVSQQIDAYGTSLQRTSSFVYDLNSNLLSTTDPRGTVTSFLYDALDRPTQQIDAYGSSLQRTSSAVYDAVDNVVKAIDPLGLTTTMAYDALNRRVTAQDPGGGISSLVYDAANNVLAATDALGHTSSYAYDALDRNTTITDARGGVTSLVYDAADNVLTLTDPVGNTTSMVYDLLSRQTQLTDPLNHTGTYAYDADNELTSTTDRLGRRIDTSYDPMGRVSSQVWIVSGTAVNTLVYGYDAANDLLNATNKNGAYTFTYDVLDRPTVAKEPFNQTLTFGYDAGDNRTTMQDSQGGTTTYIYDTLDRMTTQEFGGPGQTPLRLDFAYTPRDQLAGVTRSTSLTGSPVVGTSSFVYDPVGRLSNQQDRDASGNVFANSTLTYDLASRLTSQTVNGSTTSYGYDAINELTQAGTLTYSFDLGGNRNMSGYQTGTGNQVTNDGTWTYTYDAEGNVVKKSKGPSADTWTFGYDNQNHLTTAVEKATDGGTTLTLATYTYDTFDNLAEEDVWTQASGTTTQSRYAYDGLNAWADLSGSNALQMRRLYGGTDMPLARVSSTGTAAWYVSNWQASITDVVNAAGTMVLDQVAYDGFGQVTSETNQAQGDRFKFAGGQVDSATGWVRYWQRFYNPATGSWTSQDPLGFGGGDANLYRYVGNNATNITDLTGLSGVGHHYLPVAVAKELYQQGLLTKRGVLLAAGYWSGETKDAQGRGHGYREYGGIQHSEYNRLVREELRQYMRRRGLKRLDENEVLKFIDKLANYEAKNNDINKFNRAVDAQVVRPAHVTDCAGYIKRGRNYIRENPGRFKGLALAGMLLAALGTIQTAYDLSQSDVLPKVFRLLVEGNIPAATDVMFDPLNGFGAILDNNNVMWPTPTVPASFWLKSEWDKAVADVEKWLNELMADDAGQPSGSNGTPPTRRHLGPSHQLPSPRTLPTLQCFEASPSSSKMPLRGRRWTRLDNS